MDTTNLSLTYSSIPIKVFIRRLVGSLLLAIAALGIGSGIANVLLDTTFLASRIDEFVLQSIGIQLVGMIGIGIGFVYWLDRDIINFIGFHKPTREDVSYLLYGIFGLVLAGTIATAFFTITNTSPEQPIANMDTQTIFFVVIPTFIFIVGPAEEILFRGVIQSYIREISPPITAIIIATIFFTLVHIPVQLTTGTPLIGVIVSLGIIGSLSIIFGLMYEYTQNIWIVSILHGLYNSLIVVVTLIA